MEAVSMFMALSDFIPPLLYLAGCWCIVATMRRMGERELSHMFMAGAGLAFLSGVLKASSKVLDAAAGRPVTETGFLYDHMFPMMAVGFLATAVAIILGARRYSGRDTRGRRTPFAETSSWVSPFLAGIFLGLAFGLVLAADYAAPQLRPHLAQVKRWSMMAMIVLQLATIGILAWFSFRERIVAAGVLSVAAIVLMLAMGMLASPSMQARFEDRTLMNLLDQAVNVAAQGTFAAAALLVWLRAKAGGVAGVAGAPHMADDGRRSES